MLEDGLNSPEAATSDHHRLLGLGRRNWSVESWVRVSSIRMVSRTAGGYSGKRQGQNHGGQAQKEARHNKPLGDSWQVIFRGLLLLESGEKQKLWLFGPIDGRTR